MTLLHAAREPVERASRLGHAGRTMTRDELRTLDEKLSGAYPSWLSELLTLVPLCGLELGWQELEPARDFDGVAWLEWCDARGVLSESVDCHPGLAILEAGYVNVASCTMGSGDPYFVCIHDGGDPPLYRVAHDVSDSADVIVAEARTLVAPSLSDFFNVARVG